ncbi:RNA polymerase sigma factor [Streptomyces sp. G45]|uniref:RNA polymerase sigma factor n=1 Tax=Streptomyces sp. G45 TaxID=3406627 RepID=UPI003C1A6BE6
MADHTPHTATTTHPDVPPPEDREHLATYGYDALLSLIRSQRIYERCAAQGRPITPTPDDLETLRRSPDERHALAGDTLLKVLEDLPKLWDTWDARKGAARETYFVGALTLYFPAAFRTWQRTHRHPHPLLPHGTVATAPPPGTTQADPALDVLARDALRRALRLGGPEIHALLVMVAAGYPHSEIADRLHTTERAVEGRLYRFRKQLRNSSAGQDLREALQAQTSLLVRVRHG